ncbi:MAG: hypothetical protein H7836_14600 [Magnetococcus sp. YQC-3]
MRQLIIYNKKETPLLFNREMFERWYFAWLRYPNEFDYNSFLCLDQNTSDKIRDLQKKADEEIYDLVKKNFDKAKPLTKEYMKNYVSGSNDY